ncbi:uridine kinase [Marinomonas epiphytica]
MGMRKFFFIFLFILSPFSVLAEESEELEIEKPKLLTEAMLFGLPINDLTQTALDKQLNARGIESYPSYKEGVVNYGLGEEGILGIKILTVQYNRSGHFKQAIFAGIVEDNGKRKAIGELLERRYGKPELGFVKDGYGRAKWLFDDNCYIELHNTTFDVSVSYVDARPKTVSPSGRIDVQALSRKSQ